MTQLANEIDREDESWELTFAIFDWVNESLEQLPNPYLTDYLQFYCDKNNRLYRKTDVGLQFVPEGLSGYINSLQEQEDVFSVFLVSATDSLAQEKIQQIVTNNRCFAFSCMVLIGEVNNAYTTQQIPFTNMIVRCDSSESALVDLQALCAIMVRTGPVCIDISDLSYGYCRAGRVSKVFHSSMCSALDSEGLALSSLAELKETYPQVFEHGVESGLVIVRVSLDASIFCGNLFMELIESEGFITADSSWFWGVLMDPSLTDNQASFVLYFIED